MKKFLTLVFLIPCLLGCDRLSDNEVKALRCELWRKDGGSLNKQIYKDITGKYGCVAGVDPQPAIVAELSPSRAIQMNKILYCKK